MDSTNKGEAIAALKDLFGEMTSSRTKLKPILTEIVKALDENLFVDADSDEVHDLLEEIIDIQSQFAAVDEIKGAVSSKSVDKLDAALHNMEIKHSVNELKIVLNQFSELKCRSKKETEIETANKLMFSARKLLARGEKNGAEEFISEGLKFEYVAKIIRAREKPSSEEIAKVHDLFKDTFQDITLIYLLMDRALSFSFDAEEEAQEPEKISAVEKLKDVIDKAGLKVEGLLADDSEFEFEAREVKKRLSTKAFQSKLKGFGGGKEAEFRSVLRRLTERRIELISTITLEQSDPHNIGAVIIDRLYQIQVADKFFWKGQSFYYINDYGHELLTKMLSDGKSSLKKSSKQSISHWMRKFTVLKVLNILRLDSKKFNVESDVSQFRFRVRPIQESSTQVYYAIALMLFESNWLEQLIVTIRNLQSEEEEGHHVRALLLCTTLKGAQLTPWFRLFEETGVKNVFAIRIDGKIVGSDGDEYDVAELWTYINENEFNTFAEYKKKYIKRRKRRRKKTDEDDGESGKPNIKTQGDLFSPSADTQYSFNPQEFQEHQLMLKKKSEPLKNDEAVVKEEPPSENEEPPSEKEEPPSSVDEEPPSTVDEEPPPSVDEATVADEDVFARFQLPTELGALIDIDLERILINATVMFLKGNAARGLMELRLCDGLDDMDWTKDLTMLTATALNDPLARSDSHEFVPLEFCNEFFSRPTPLAQLDPDYLKGFYVTMFVMIKSYAPDLNAIYELRSQQAQLLSDKTNAALKMCPSIKKLISLFKAFTEKTNASFAASLHIDHAGVREQLRRAEADLSLASLRADSNLKQKLRHPRVKALVYRLFDTGAELRRMIDRDGVTTDDITKFYSSFLALPLDDESISSEKIFAPQKIDAYLDDIWESIKVDSHKSENFMGNERTRQTNLLEKALAALRAYAIARRKLDSLGDDSSASKTEALALFDVIRAEFESNIQHEFSVNLIAPSVLMLSLKQLRSDIAGEESTLFYRDCLLGSKYIELTSKDLPDPYDRGAARYSFAHRLVEYERALMGLTPDEALKAAYETAVRTYDLGIIDRLEKNYGAQLTRPAEERQRLRAVMSAQIDKRLDILHYGFIKKMVLDQNYGRLLNPGEADYYEMVSATALHHFSETRNAGLFERFIDALNFGINLGMEPYVKELRARLNEVEPENQALVENLIECGRLNVAEDCINDGVFVKNFDVNGLEDFLSAYESIFNVCVKHKNDSLEKILIGLKRDMKDKQLLEFTDAWQNASSKQTLFPLFLKHLSFEGAVLEPIRKLSNDHLMFHATFTGAPCDVPIALFNSRLRTDGLDVVCVHYPLTLEQLLERLRAVERRTCGLLCILNMALSLADRRKLAQAMRLRAELKNIIVIDRLLAVYLTAFEQSERRERLLKAALPFANVNPFEESSDELFVGRERELEELRNINGATFLIGGRQLGKTALLEQLIALEHKPDEDIYVICSDGTDVERLRAEVIERLSSDDVRKVIAIFDVNLMIAKLDKNLEPMAQLAKEYSGRFKYIVTAHHGLSLNDSAVRLRPLTAEEATRLTVEPLNYLGLRVPDVDVMRSVWLRANYNPAMLRYYCGQIVEAIADGYEQKKFDATSNPPYDFDDEFLKRMKISLEGMMKRVLQDGRDDYYYVMMLALAYAPMYYNDPHTTLFRLQEICLANDIDDLAAMSGEQMELLIEELIALKLFRRAGDTYEFYRREYRYMFGSNEQTLELRLTECKAVRTNA